MAGPRVIPGRAPLIFAQLGLWLDPVARGGPAQMACDEALLRAATRPILRVFRWAAPWVSAGYFVPWAEAAVVRPDLPVCRRWTGGGIVVHDGDLTFSLAVPRGESWAALRPAESYRQLHEALAQALRGAGVEAELSEEAQSAGQQCFARPVRHDILSTGKKIVGGAQRRTKAGLLHQGSIQGARFEANALASLGTALAGQTLIWEPPAGMEAEIGRLEAAKYGRREFIYGSNGPGRPSCAPQG